MVYKIEIIETLSKIVVNILVLTAFAEQEDLVLDYSKPDWISV